MKLTKKVLALSISLAMASAMGVTTFADDGVTTGTTTTIGTYSITINKAMGTYKAYQVFKGTLSSTHVLSNVEWGDGVTTFEYDSTSDASKIADKLKNLQNDSTQVQTFATNAANHIINGKSSGQATAANGVAQITGLAPGYYVIVNSDVTGEGKAVSSYILQVTKDQTIENKADVPTFEKKIIDKNDTEGTITGWQDSADYDIGDRIPFKLEGTVAKNYTDYKSDYKFVFHDIEEKGLEFDKKSVHVYVDNNEITKGYTITKPSDGCTFEIAFARLQDVQNVTNGSTIRVEYESVLTEDAKLGEEGNLNKAKLEYSNNPNNTQGGENTPTGETPWDNVIVFTYKVVINKIDDNKQPLTGAEFKLFKKVKNGENIDEVEVTRVTLNTAKTSFTFKGLDDGNYVLKETKTPENYNSIDNIEFKVEADHTITWNETNPDRNNVLTKLDGNKVTGEITFTSDKQKGSLSANVVNKQGSLLPSTGGIGTTIFYVVGVILMLGAGVLLVTKKRMSSNR